MKGGILAFFAGIATAVGIGALRSKGLAVGTASGLSTLDLNSAPAEAFKVLGFEPEVADRIVDNRPYRRKLELLERFVLSQAEYDRIKNRVSTDQKHANDAVVIAS